MERIPDVSVMDVVISPIITHPAPDPDAPCDRCGRIGVVAYFTPAPVSAEARPEQYCDACWQVVHYDHGRRTGQWSIHSWRVVEDFFREVEEGTTENRRRGKLTAEDEVQAADFLAQAVADTLRDAHMLAGEMPPAVKSFVERYGRRS
jgi:hypothetical protein